MLLILVLSISSQSMGNPRYLTELNLRTAPSKMHYNINEPFNLEGCTLEAVYSDGTSQVIGSDVLSWKGYDNSQEGSQLVAILYDNKSVLINVEVSKAELLNIITTQTDYNKHWFIGDTVAQSDIIVTKQYSNGSTQTTEYYTIENPDITRQGNNTITVSAEGLKSQVVINAREDSVESLLINNPVKVQFFVGEEFNCDGMQVSAVFSSGKKVDITSDVAISTPNLDIVGTTYVEVSYKGIRSTYPIDVLKPEYESMDTSHWRGERIVYLKFNNREEPVKVASDRVREIISEDGTSRTLIVSYGDQTYTNTDTVEATNKKYVASKRVNITVPIGIDLVSNSIQSADVYSANNAKVTISSTEQNRKIVKLPVLVNFKQNTSTVVDFSVHANIEAKGYMCLDSILEVHK